MCGINVRKRCCAKRIIDRAERECFLKQERSTDLKQIFVRTESKDERSEQQKRCSPVMVHIPHSSTVIPDDEIDHFIAGELEGELLKMTDHYCDDLFDCEHDKLVFPVSRLVCDVERFRDDAREHMAACGMGFAYTHGSGLQKIRELTPDHKLGIETCYYAPHHNEFECMVQRRVREHGKCLIIDGHSFPGKALPYEMDDRTERPDICVGSDAYHTSRELSDMTKEFFEGKGYKVAVNDPFSGSIVPMSYYQKNPDVQSVMIEINRDLYMDAAARKTNGYAKVKRDVGEYLDRISKWFEEK